MKGDIRRLSLPAIYLFLLMLGMLLGRSIFPESFRSGQAHYWLIIPLLFVISRLRLGRSSPVDCPRWIMIGSIVVLSGIGAISLINDLVDLIYPPAVVVERFDGDSIGSTTARFAEQLSNQWQQNDLRGDKKFRFSLRNRTGSDNNTATAPFFRIAGTERWLRVSMQPAQPTLLTSVAHPLLIPFIPPLRLWGGGVPFGMEVDQIGATAQFLTLLADGMMTESEEGDLALIDAAKLGGKWTSRIHQGIPLLLAAERRLKRAVRGEHLQMVYVSCALRQLSRALSSGSFHGDPELEAALRTDYGVALWLSGISTPGLTPQHRAIALWKKVASRKELPEHARVAARENAAWAVAELAKGKKANRKKSRNNRGAK